MAKKDVVFKKRKYKDAVDFLEKRYGKDVLVSKKSNVNIERLKTGFYKFDKSIGGGLPKGRIIEIYGNEGCGKTSLLLQIASVVQRQKKQNLVLYLDFENSLDTFYAEDLGVSLDDSVWNLSQPESLEIGIDILGVLAYTGEVGMVIVDSVAAMTPMSELEGSMEKDTIGAQARGLGKAFRKLVRVIKQSGTICVFINQMRDKIGGFGTPYTTPGGKAIKFYSSLRIRVNSRKSGWFDGGINSSFKVVKNKTSINQGEKTDYELDPGKGFLREFEIFQMAEEVGLVKSTKRSYIFAKKKMNLEKLLEVLKKEKVRDKIITIWEKKQK